MIRITRFPQLGLIFGFIVFVFSLTTLVGAAEAEPNGNLSVFSRTYQVNPQTASLSLRGITGPITVTTADRNEIRIKAELSAPLAKLMDTQLDNKVQLEVLNDSSGPVRFEIVVPPQCTLDLKCIDGAITVNDAQGKLTVETTDGDITLLNISGTEVTARSTSGKVVYNGDISPQGNYTFQSFNNLIDLTVPASASFQLAGTAFTGDVNLGGLNIANFIPGSRKLIGSYGQGGGKIHLTTHKGQIRFHKKK